MDEHPTAKPKVSDRIKHERPAANKYNMLSAKAGMLYKKILESVNFNQYKLSIISPAMYVII